MRRRYIREGSFCGGGDALPIALGQQTGKDGGRLAPGHIPVRPKGAVGVAHHIGPVILGLHNSGNRQLAVLVGFPGFLLAQVAFNGDGQVLLGLTLLVGDRDGDPVVLVHVGAVRQGDSDGAGFSDRYPGISMGRPVS